MNVLVSVELVLEYLAIMGTIVWILKNGDPQSRRRSFEVTGVTAGHVDATEIGFRIVFTGRLAMGLP